MAPMPTKEQKADYYLFSIWAGVTVPRCSAGFEALRRVFRYDDGRLLELGKAKSMIYPALERLGIDPHDRNDPNAVGKAWKMLHRRYLKAGHLQ